MRYAYDPEYLPLTQRVMSDMYDYAVNELSYSLSDFHKMFLISGMAKQFEIANPMYVAGKNGCEIARIIIAESTGQTIHHEDIMYLDKSPEAWVGWALSYYQWYSAYGFRYINDCITMDALVGMHATCHEADISKFVTIMDEKCMSHAASSQLQRLRSYARLSQRQLSDTSGVPLRQIQLFEQGQRDIRKTQGATLLALSRVLKCSCEELLQ